MAIFKDFKMFQSGGMDFDSGIPLIAKNDYLEAYNVRVSGTTIHEAGYISNIESNFSASPDISPSLGLSKAIGFAGFEQPRIAVGFIANTANQNQIQVLDYDTNLQSAAYTDIVQAASGDILLPLDPDDYVQVKLVNNDFLIWADGKTEVGYTNLTALRAGLYGDLIQEDLTLIKPQNLIPITGEYISDAGSAANFLKGKLFQFTSQYVNTEFNYSAWGTWSKRIIPPEESTPSVGTDVSVNNGIVVSVYAGSKRAQTLNIAARYSENIYNIVKTVTREYILLLPDTIDIPNQIRESYDPATNIYSFVFYNESVNIAVTPTETDLLYDYIWPSNAIEVINGNIIGLGDLKVGYPRPDIPVSVQASGYDPNISIPANTLTNRAKVKYFHTFFNTVPPILGSNVIKVTYGGVPVTGDAFTIILSKTGNTTQTLLYPYTVLSGDGGDLLTVVSHLSARIPASSYTLDPSTGQVTLTIPNFDSYGGQAAYVTLTNPGATVSKSIHAILDNSTYQLALAYYDIWGRAFPLDTNNAFIVQTPSYAQLNGLTPQFSWVIQQTLAPNGAVRYQWVITKNQTVIQGALLDVLGNLIDYKGQWDAETNTTSPGGIHLAPGTGTVGDTYQISVPDETATVNLGNGSVNYKTGDFIVYNGSSWDIVDKLFGDMTSFETAMYIKINPLALFNQLYSNNGFDTVLNYDFSQGDRCTLHYYIDGSTNNYFNLPCIDVTVFGYDPTTNILKIEKSASLAYTTDIEYNGAIINGKDVFLRLYSPKTTIDTTETTTDNTTVWYEIGESFPVVDGNHSVLNGLITDGDVYFKTRQYQGAVDPNTGYSVLATDFNFSDFYPSEFTSYGRPRSYYDQLEKTIRKASIITSQPYILGSRVNGLNRFYPENLYGDSNGQCSSSKGEIGFLWQRGDVLVVGQELDVFYIPVNYAYTVLNQQLTGQSISEKLLNNGRYSTRGIGIGKAKESFCSYDGNGYFVDPNRSEPIKVTVSDVAPISGKMQKFFKRVLQEAYAKGYKLIGYFDTYNMEYVLSVQLAGNTLLSFPFNILNWNPFGSYSVSPDEIISLTDDANFSASYDTLTGIATFVPDPSFIGNDTSVYTFFAATGNVSKNICLNWTAGDGVPFDFMFTALFNQPLSTLRYSNVMAVSGIDITVPISITGGEYSVNGGAYTSSAGTVRNSDNVQVRQTSSASNSTLTTATLTIGGVSAGFDVTTLASGVFLSMLAVPNMIDPNQFDVTGTITAPLTGDIGVHANVIFNGSLVRSASVNILTGNTTGSTIVFSSPHYFEPTVTIDILSVTPNPVMGVTVNY